MKYRDHEEAKHRGGKDIWPGCGITGRCMPCGGIHNFDYRSHANGPYVDRYRCSQNHHSGCPQPKREPSHDFNKSGHCKRCSARDPRPRLSRAQLRLLKRAADADRDGTSIVGIEYVSARALARQGFGELRGGCGWEGTFKLNDKGHEIARSLGLAPDPYAEGADAALAGVSDTKNPYPCPGDKHLSWNDGYLSITER